MRRWPLLPLHPWTTFLFFSLASPAKLSPHPAIWHQTSCIVLDQKKLPPTRPTLPTRTDPPYHHNSRLQASYMVLDQNISPVTFSVGNTMKRVAVVVSSVLFFKNPVSGPAY